MARTIDIDELVRQVLVQLGLAPQAPPAATAIPPGANGSPAPGASNSPAAGEVRSPADKPLATPVAPARESIVVASRVVTLAELGDRLTGARQVVVPAKAIVTPAVRDELQRRKIVLVRASDASKATTPAANGVRLLAIVAGSAIEPAVLAAALGGEGIVAETEVSDCLIAATDRMAGEIGQGNTLGLLLTTWSAAALCLANRHSGVRAILGTDAQTVAAATASVGANLLVLDPTVLGIFALRQIVGRFYREPRHECPEVFAKRLG